MNITLKNKVSSKKSNANFVLFTVDGYDGTIYFPKTMFASVPETLEMDIEALAPARAAKPTRVAVSKDPVKAAEQLKKAEERASKATERANKEAERAKKLAELVAKMAPAPTVEESTEETADVNVDESIEESVTDTEEAIA